MKTLGSCCIALLVILVVFPAQALADLVLYDDFEAEFIDVNKWTPIEFRDGLPGEAVREIHGQRLHMIYRAYGDLGSASGGVAGRNRLQFPGQIASAITAIEATVSVKEFEATGCEENPDAAQARARIFGIFFLLPHPDFGGALMPVIADIRVVRFSDSTDAPNLLRVISRLFLCDNVTCLQGAVIHTVDWGTIETARSARLFIKWDQATQTFTSQRDAMPPDVHQLTGAVTTLAGAKRLEISPEVVNCLTPPRRVSYTEAFFDNVRVNPPPAP